MFRRGVFPQLSTRGLEALRDGLEKDDAGLLQGTTCIPAPLQCCQDMDVKGVCLMSYPFWKTGATTVGDVEEAFAHLCFLTDQVMGEPAACREVINRWDDEPRDKVRHEMLIEVGLELANRENLRK